MHTLDVRDGGSVDAPLSAQAYHARQVFSSAFSPWRIRR
jgi:hypothetical protein